MPNLQLGIGEPEITNPIVLRGKVIGQGAFFRCHGLQICRQAIKLSRLEAKFDLGLVQLLIQIGKGPVKIVANGAGPIDFEHGRVLLGDLFAYRFF